MSSRPLRWFGGLIAGLVLLSVASLIPGTGLGPVKVTEAQPYNVAGVASGQAASQCTLRIWGGRCIIP